MAETGSITRCFALVPCAGVGSRAGIDGPKQYAPIAGRALVAHTLDALRQVPRVSATLVVLAPQDDVFERHVPQFAGSKGWVARCGGATRAASVANGLDVLLDHGAGLDDWVVVHDAARCLLQAKWVERLIDACFDDKVGGLLALPVADTLKQDRGGRVEATIERAGKWAAQTPQMFRVGALRGALARCGGHVTDESSAIESTGASPLLVRGEAGNIKVTWPEDFCLAECLIEARQRACCRSTGS